MFVVDSGKCLLKLCICLFYIFICATSYDYFHRSSSYIYILQLRRKTKIFYYDSDESFDDLQCNDSSTANSPTKHPTSSMQGSQHFLRYV